MVFILLFGDPVARDRDAEKQNDPHLSGNGSSHDAPNELELVNDFTLKMDCILFICGPLNRK
jgi:hypothetical protein